MFKALVLLPLLASLISPSSAAPTYASGGRIARPRTEVVHQKRVTHPNAITNDAPFSLNQTVLDSVPLNCPYPYKSGQKALLLIHGTASTGDESFSQGLGLSFHAANFYVCYPNLPNRTLSDAQVTSEFVVNFIRKLYAQMGNETISVLGHSQGNLNIQWALNFWPTTRNMVDDFISLAGDFHGTSEGLVSCTLQQLLASGCAAATIQQTVGSEYLAALNKYGNMALVDTTSVYTYYDDVIQPETPPDPTSVLPGATNQAVQDLCGPAHLADHFSMIVDGAAYQIAIDALTHTGPADIARVRSDGGTAMACLPGSFAPGISVLNLPALVKSIVMDVLELSSNDFLTQSVRHEPALMPYAANQPYNG
jgi:pimeloyl-ACP methyl ester carboxylesterase